MAPKLAEKALFVNTTDAEVTVGDEDITQGQLVARLCADDASPIANRLRQAKIQKVEWNDISGDGCTSRIYRVVLRLTEPEDSVSVILKSFSFQRVNDYVKEFIGIVITQLPAEQRKLLLRDFGAVHDAECTFYGLFAQPKCTVANASLPLVAIYDIEKIEFDENEIPKGIILMEDLTASTCIVPITDGLSEAQVRRVVDVIADFHATLLCDKNKEARWKSEIVEGNMMAKTSERHYDSFMKVLDNGFDKGALLKSLKRLEKTMRETFDTFVHEKIVKEAGLPLLISHGDMWTNNLLWKQRASEGNAAVSDELVAIIDWQICHRGNPMADFARLLITSCQTDVRERADTWIVSYYHERLAKRLQQNGINLDFTLNDLQRAYDFAKVIQSIYNTITIEPIYRTLSTQCSDPQYINMQMDQLVDRALTAMRDAEQFLAANAPEWLPDEVDK